MSEEQNAGLHQEGSAAWRKLARLREAAEIIRCANFARDCGLRAGRT